MPVMNIRIVRMVMKQFTVYVQMAVSFMGQDQFSVVVEVVLVVYMAVAMLKGVVPVLVAMTFCQVQPYAKAHKPSTCHKIGSDPLSKNQN
jgi:hypothetical protein